MGPAALHAKLAGRLSRRAGLRVFRLFSRPVGLQRSETPGGMRFQLLLERDALELCRHPGLDLRHDGVAAAYARGDLCFAAFAADVVSGYCWLAFAPLPHLDGAWVEFGRHVGWIYKSLVLPQYRGRGIAPALYRLADAQTLERGRSHSLICVENHNTPSVSAALRAGYEAAGFSAFLKRPSRLHTWYSSATKRQGVRFYLP